MIIFLIYLALGAVVGVYAGLLGVGGGVILVPLLDITLNFSDVNSSIAHYMALGTSMASIMFTSISSAYSHSKRGNVDWSLVKTMTPWIFMGTLLGTFVVAKVPTDALKIIFALFLFYSALQMFFDFKPKTAWSKPGKTTFMVAGGVIGLVSSFIGIGGGSLTIPFLVLCSVPMLGTIGVSSALGLPLAMAGTIGFVINGWGHPDLPEHSLGFVYLPALAGLALASIITAPYGVRLAHYMPIAVLKKGFALLLLFLSLRMGYSVFF